MKRISMTALCMAVSLAGCWRMSERQMAAALQDAPAQGDAAYLPKSAIADQTADETESAVERALEWSRKYSEAVEKLVAAQQEHSAAQEQNRQLAGQATKLQAELAQSRKELADANAMLLELRGELQKWKKDVLGFRGEMRSSQQAQLEALSKVLRLLGGEVVGPTTRPAPTAAAQGKEVARGQND